MIKGVVLPQDAMTEPWELQHLEALKDEALIF